MVMYKVVKLKKSLRRIDVPFDNAVERFSIIIDGNQLRQYKENFAWY